MQSRLTTALAAIAALMGVLPYAHGVPTLRLSDGIATVQGFDNLAGFDLNPLPGAVTWSSPIGGWTINVTTGLSKPALGNPVLPFMDLNSVNVSGTLPGKLAISFSDDLFVAGNGQFGLDVGGTMAAGPGSTASFSAFVDPGNTLFAPTIPVGGFNFVGAGAFSGSGVGSVGPLPGPYSITLSALLDFKALETQGGIGVASFDFALTGQREQRRVPDAGASVGLLLLGLSPLAAFARRRKGA